MFNKVSSNLNIFLKSVAYLPVFMVLFCCFYFKAGILPPHPRSLVTAAKNREALAAGALSSDVLEGAENDDEQDEENTKDS